MASGGRLLGGKSTYEPSISLQSLRWPGCWELNVRWMAVSTVWKTGLGFSGGGAKRGVPSEFMGGAPATAVPTGGIGVW